VVSSSYFSTRGPGVRRLAALLFHFVSFLFSKSAAKAAAPAAVHLPRPAACAAVISLTSFTAKAFYYAPVAADKRSRQRADRARYHAQCRRAMSF